MPIEINLQMIKEEFPDSKIICCYEIGLPYYKKEVYCNISIEKGLPIVMDYVIRLINLGYKLKEIVDFLGIDSEVVTSAYYNLIQEDFIHYNGKGLTDEGKDYLRENRYEDIELVPIVVNIDSYSNKIERNISYMSNYYAMKNKIFTIKPLLNPIKIKDYTRDFKNVFNNEILSIYPDFKGELLEIVAEENLLSEFRPIELFILEMQDKTVRFIPYDRGQKLSDLEMALYNADSVDIALFENKTGDYFKYPQEEIDFEKVEYYDILNNALLDSDYNQLHYSIPLIDLFMFKEDWLLKLERCLKNTKVIIDFYGSRFSSNKLRQTVMEFFKYSLKNDNLTVNHFNYYQRPSVLINKKERYLNDIYKYEISNRFNNIVLSQNSYRIIEENVEDNIRSYNFNIEYDDKNLQMDIKALLKQAKKMNDYMIDYNGVGWLYEGDVYNEFKLDALKVAKNFKEFTSFTTILYSSIGEVIPANGKKYKLNNYYNNGFKEDFPNIWEAIERLRVYRNSECHKDLDQMTSESYNLFINKDLNGSFPEFLNKEVYKFLQYKIMKELLLAIEKTLKDLVYS